MSFFERSNDAYMHAYGRYDITFTHGQGVFLYDECNQQYLDFYSGIGVNALGYNHPKYVQAMQEQIAKLMHVSNYFNTPSGVEGAEALKKATQLDLVFLCNSGTEATEGALKLARKYYYQKNQIANSEIIALHHSFHGRSTGSVRLTGNENYQKAFGPLIEGVKHALINDLESVKNLITKQTGAIIVEPVQGEGGLTACSKDFLQGLRQICDELDIVLIFDEVQCGCGRTGEMMTYMHYDVKPDIVCLAKGIGAGFPVGAFVANKKVGSALKPGDHGSTYGGNPLAGKAVTTVMEIIEEEKIIENVKVVGAYLTTKLDELVQKYDLVLERKGLGLMQGLVIDGLASDYVKKAQEKGVLFVSAGANVLRFLPPLIITKENVDQFINVLEQLFNQK